MNIREGVFYTIIAIQPKSGALCPVHQEMLGRPALLVSAQPDAPAFLRIRPIHDRTYHTYRTSPITRCDPVSSGLVIETENTVYTLERGNKSGT